MRNYIIAIFIFFSVSSFCQINNARDLAIELSKRNIEMSELVSYANEKFNDSIDKAKFIYYWIGFNIKYDHKFLKDKLSLSFQEYHKKYSYNHYPTQVFIKRLAVCSGYSTLYNWFMKELGIECKIVKGFIRDERNHYVELESDFDFRHAWNAIKINEKWMLVDTTWGTSLNEEVADFYFDIPPKRAIITYYPKKNKWQLLEKPLSLEKFNNSIYVNPIWFKVGFSDVPRLKMDYKYYYLIFKSNLNKKWIANLLYSVDNKKFYQLKSLDRIEQDQYTILRFYKSVVPKKTYFKINLHSYINENENHLIYSDVINFKM